MTDQEIRSRGMKVLAETLGDIEMERFMLLAQRQNFDYTEWRSQLPEESSLEALAQKAAMEVPAGSFSKAIS